MSDKHRSNGMSFAETHYHDIVPMIPFCGYDDDDEYQVESDSILLVVSKSLLLST